ncbi:MAG: hypothetical protein R2882_12980 [Gemmatimonadales bacterium]
MPDDLLARWDADPAYTSYPAVPDWTGGVTTATWLAHLGDVAGQGGPLALYVHLPFCAERCLYCGCNATVTNRRDVVERYLDREAEIDLISGALGRGPPVEETYWGGGTPNLLDDSQLARLVGLLRRRFAVAPGAEWSIEADPSAGAPAGSSITSGPSASPGSVSGFRTRPAGSGSDRPKPAGGARPVRRCRRPAGRLRGHQLRPHLRPAAPDSRRV